MPADRSGLHQAAHPVEPGLPADPGRGYWRRLPLRQRALGAYILSNPYVMALSWLMIPAAIATAVLIKEPIGITLLSFLPVLPMLGMLVAEGVAIGGVLPHLR